MHDFTFLQDKTMHQNIKFVIHKSFKSKGIRHIQYLVAADYISYIQDM